LGDLRKRKIRERRSEGLELISSERQELRRTYLDKGTRWVGIKRCLEEIEIIKASDSRAELRPVNKGEDSQTNPYPWEDKKRK